MAAVSIVGTSQRVVDAPGLTIDELAGNNTLLHKVVLLYSYTLQSVKITYHTEIISLSIKNVSILNFEKCIR